VKLPDHLVTADPEGLRRRIKIEPMPRSFLQLFAISVALRFRLGARVIQLASGSMPTITMRMLRDLPDQVFPVRLRHPIFGSIRIS